MVPHVLLTVVWSEGGWKGLKEPVKTDPTVWMEARKQLSLCKNKRLPRGEEAEAPIFIPTTTQAQLGGVSGNDPLELILIRSGDRLCRCIGVVGNLMHM